MYIQAPPHMLFVSSYLSTTRCSFNILTSKIWLWRRARIGWSLCLVMVALQPSNSKQLDINEISVGQYNKIGVFKMDAQTEDYRSNALPTELLRHLSNLLKSLRLIAKHRAREYREKTTPWQKFMPCNLICHRVYFNLLMILFVI